MQKDKWRVDYCKCGRKIYWDPYVDRIVTCGRCKREYKVDCDSILVYWLVQKTKIEKPWMTEAR